MIEIVAMRPGDALWQDTITLAENCSWRAGKALADIMRNDRLLDWELVFAACENGVPVGFCTLAERDELPEELDFTPFIGFVFVDEAHRGRRISQKLIEAAMERARNLGYDRVYIMSGEQGLYEKYGFEKLGDYKTIYGYVDQLFEKRT